MLRLAAVACPELPLPAIQQGQPIALVIADTLEEAVHAATLVRGARFAAIPDAGHSVYFEQPEAFTQTVLEFLLSDIGP